MGARPQQYVADFVGHDMAENITYVFLSTSSHVLHAIDEYAVRDGY